jgi:Protein of unknown function (DUF3810)
MIFFNVSKFWVKSYFGFVFGLIIWLTNWVGQSIGHSFFAFYQTYIFRFIRSFYDYTLYFLPFASIYLILPLVVLAMYKYVKKKDINYENKLTNGFRKVVNIAGIWYGSFYLLWGFNYHEPTIADVARLENINITDQMVFAELQMVTKELNILRQEADIDTTEMDQFTSIEFIETDVRSLLKRVLVYLKTDTTANVRVRPLYPRGTLLSLTTAGIYIPYTFEGHFDPGIAKVQYPFTIAHEMSHGYGYTDEGVCNFLAYLACKKSKFPYIKYSGSLGYWRYLYNYFLNIDEKLAKMELKSLTVGVKNDIKAIRRQNNAYLELMPTLRDLIYDSYLKANGIQSGLDSYFEVIKWVILLKRNPSSPLLQ